jgi:hypothetical protein
MVNQAGAFPILVNPMAKSAVAQPHSEFPAPLSEFCAHRFGLFLFVQAVALFLQGIIVKMGERGSFFSQRAEK